MKAAARVMAILPALLATSVLASVIITGVKTVMELRAFGRSEFPLIAPLNLFPALLILSSVWAFARGRNVLAALFGLAALAVASVFWISQASGALG
jgi:hypothetical protein